MDTTVGAERRVVVLACTAMVLIASSLLLPLVHHRGLLGWDSNWYLRQALFFVNGWGLHSWVPIGGVEPSPFVVFPIGYPAAIAAVSTITGAPVFWASKLVNAACALLALLLIARGLPSIGWITGTSLLSAGVLLSYASTFSEGPFIVAVVAAALALGRLLAGAGFRYAGALALALGLGYAIRYAGILLFPPLALAIAWTWWSGREAVARRIAAGAFGGAVLVAAHMALTYSLIRRPTPPRSPSSDALPTYLYNTAKAFLTELNVAFVRVPNPRDTFDFVFFTVVLALSAALVIMVVRQPRSDSHWRDLSAVERSSIGAFALIGACFWAGMATLRFLLYFNPLGYRYLAPGTVLLLGAFIAWLWSRGLYRNHAGMVLAAAIALGVVGNFGIVRPYRMWREEPRVFTERLRELSDRYADIPPGAVVLQASVHLLFLRPDLIVTPPSKGLVVRYEPSQLQSYVEQGVACGRSVWVDDGARVYEASSDGSAARDAQDGE